MMKNLTSFIFFIFYFTVNGQFYPVNPFKPTLPTGINHLWYKNIFDSTAINNNFDGYNQFKGRFQELAQISGDNIFLVFQRQGDLGAIGYYLEKRSLTTGNLLWRKYFGFMATQYIDMPRHLHINENGNLEIFSQMFPDPQSNNPGIGSRKMVFMFREIDHSDGKIITESAGDPTDDDTFRSHFTFLYAGTISSIFRIDRDKYLFFELDAKAGQVKKYKSSIVSSNSKKSTTRTDSIAVISFLSTIPPVQISKNKYLLIERILATNHFIFRQIDDRLNASSQDTTLVVGPLISYPEVIGIDTSNKVLLLKNFRDSDLSSQAIDIIWFGFDGKLLHKWSMDQSYQGGFDIIDWSPQHIKMLVSKLPKNFPDSPPISADVIEYSISDSIKTIQSFPNDDKLRFVNEFFLYPIANTEDLIVRWSELAFYYDVDNNFQRDLNASAMSVLRIRKLDLLSSLKDIVKPKMLMTITPNPTAGDVVISLPSKISGVVNIYSSDGFCIHSIDIKNDDKILINLANTNPGTYFININDGRGNILARSKLIKI